MSKLFWEVANSDLLDTNIIINMQNQNMFYRNMTTV